MGQIRKNDREESRRNGGNCR
ncbi:hypothetical protein CL3_20030 [butyrate-producing bacterium SM4/1]|nr:hypothetical protein CLS_29180 [[Clostridium] cf. saccharolyticum K10]CBL36396.1 hypothetical protein CL3_20030 [butyrate-producing bacterium SM4/1]